MVRPYADLSTFEAQFHSAHHLVVWIDEGEGVPRKEDAHDHFFAEVRGVVQDLDQVMNIF